jgi:hypothetical protein
MTEPDEAMKYARAMKASNNETYLMARAYRAGQAASAERIKALEEALRAWVEKECDYMRRNDLGNPEVQPAVIWSRALLKEADQ